MVNRELTRRVKFGQEVAWASRPVSSDILVTLDLVKALDKKAGLWEHAMLESAELKVLYYTCAYMSEAKSHFILLAVKPSCYCPCLIAVRRANVRRHTWR